jgi:hypothetical protein
VEEESLRCCCFAQHSRTGGRSFGFRVSGFEFRVSGFGFRVSSFGFRVSGFGFRVSRSGLEVDGHLSSTRFLRHCFTKSHASGEKRSVGNAGGSSSTTLEGSGFRV